MTDEAGEVGGQGPLMEGLVPHPEELDLLLRAMGVSTMGFTRRVG